MVGKRAKEALGMGDLFINGGKNEKKTDRKKQQKA